MEILKKIKNKLNYILTDFASWKHVSWPMRAKILRWLGMDIHETALIGYGFDITEVNKVKLGKNVYINKFPYMISEGGIEIEDDVRLAAHVKIITTYHPTEKHIIRRKPGEDYNFPCKIGRGAWLGLGSVILPKVNIAEGCVIAAGAVVTKSTEPNGLYAGVPAKRIKDLPVGDED